MPRSTHGLKRDLAQHAGFITARRTAKDGGWNTLYDAREQGSEDDGGRWMIVCEQHGSVVQFTNQRLARQHLRWPDFCDCCRDHANEQDRLYECPSCGKPADVK